MPMPMPMPMSMPMPMPMPFVGLAAYPPPPPQYFHPPGGVYPPAPVMGSGGGGGGGAMAAEAAGAAPAPVVEMKRSANLSGEEVKAAPAKLLGKPVFRQAGGDRWEDKSLGEWPENDYRIFVGDLGLEVNDDLLTKAFSKYPTFQKAKVVKDKSSGKSKGFGFVSLMDPGDYAKVRCPRPPLTSNAQSPTPAGLALHLGSRPNRPSKNDPTPSSMGPNTFEVESLLLLSAHPLPIPSQYNSNSSHLLSHPPRPSPWAMKEMNGRYIGNRPCKLKKSDWATRNDASTVKNKVAPKRKPMNKRKHLPQGPALKPKPE